MVHRFFAVMVLVLCPVAAGASAPAHDWSARFGDADDQSLSAVVTDVDGNIYVCGQFWGAIDLGGGALTSAGMGDMFIAKFDVNGGHVWSRGFGGPGNEFPAGMAIDATGHVFVTGDVDGTASVDFGGGPLASSAFYDVFLAKYDSDGVHQWSRVWGDGNYQECMDVTTDATGNVVITGGFEGSIDFGGGALNSAGSLDVFVAKFAANGSHVFSSRYGTSLSQGGVVIAADGADNLYVGGIMRGTINFGGATLTSAGLDDVFLTKFTPAGTHLWSKRFGSVDLQGISGLDVDSAGNAVITGSFTQTIDFGGGPLVATVGFGWDIYVARLAPDGAHAWSWKAGDAEYQSATSAAFADAGHVVIAGDFAGAIDLGGGPLTNTDFGSDLFLAEFDASGAHVWSCQIADTSGVSGAATVDASGAVVTAGHFLGTVDFGGGPLSSTGDYTNDIYVARLSSGSSAVPPSAMPMGVRSSRPNPFNPSTTITFALAARGRAVLEIADLRGAIVSRLDLGELEAGTHEARWEGRDLQGGALPSGVYLCRLAGNDAAAGHKLVMLR